MRLGRSDGFISADRVEPALGVGRGWWACCAVPPLELLWADRDFRLYWVSRVVSYAGGTITYVAAPILVYSLTGSRCSPA